MVDCLWGWDLVWEYGGCFGVILPLIIYNYAAASPSQRSPQTVHQRQRSHPPGTAPPARLSAAGRAQNKPPAATRIAVESGRSEIGHGGGKAPPVNAKTKHLRPPTCRHHPRGSHIEQDHRPQADAVHFETERRFVQAVQEGPGGKTGDPKEGDREELSGPERSQPQASKGRLHA